jgi:zinc/manganese transport system permease protein
VLELIDWTIIGPAFVAGLVVLSTHVPLGQEVLKRGIIFIDLAIAQVAGLGVIAAHGMDWDPDGLEVQVAAVSAAKSHSSAFFLFLQRPAVSCCWPEIRTAVNI